MKILIVDDVPTNRKLLGAILEAEGHTVVQAEDGLQALAALEAEGADAIISDILMPNMDGYRLCLEVRQSERFHQVPFIAYTATYVSAGDEQAVLDLGADAYVRKPASAKTIVDSLNRVTKLKRNSTVPNDLVEAYSERVAHKLHQMQSDHVSKARIAKLNKKLTKSNAQLGEIARFKSEFLSTASHEMRTPLAIIREFASILSDRIPGDLNHDQGSCVGSILRNCDRLTVLIDDLLDLAKIEAGRIVIQRESLDLGEFLAECVLDFGPRFETKAQTLLLEMDERAVPFVLADRAKIQQVLVNLIGNAHKFTPERGSVIVSAHVEGESVLIKVADNGPGIDQSELESIFEAFTQIDRQDGPGIRGTGLGLTISQKIVQCHGGDIHVESELGQGTHFSFALPVYSAWKDQQAFLTDHARSAKNGTVTTVVALSIKESGSESGIVDMSATKLLCDRALAGAKPCSAISDDGTLLYAFDSTKAILLSDVEKLLKGIADIGVTVFSGNDNTVKGVLASKQRRRHDDFPLSNNRTLRVSSQLIPPQAPMRGALPAMQGS